MPDEKLWTCPRCGTSNADRGKYCGECGSARQAAEGDGPHSQLLRKTVTVLFADLKGSTQAISSLDAESAMRRLRPLVAAMATAVREQGGTVLEVRGDGLLASFGAVDSTAEHALGACRSAIELKRRVREVPQFGLPVRIGIHTGEVVVLFDERGTCSLSGATVHLASRLEQAAEPNTVLISDATYRAVAKLVDVRPRGRLTFKGFDQAVETWELLDAGQLSRWETPATLGLSDFVGRESGLNAVQALIAAAQAGEGGAVCILGDAGTGKSRLMREALTQQRRGASTVWAAGTEQASRQTPYAVARTLARQWLGLNEHSGRNEVETRLALVTQQFSTTLADHEVALRALLNLDVKSTGWSEWDALHRRKLLSAAFTEICRLQAATRPLVIAIDDLHWCDDDTLHLLAPLTAGSGAPRLALAMTMRPSPTFVLAELFPLAKLIQLQEFSSEEADRFLTAVLGADSSLRSLKERLFELTGGLPFFLEESVRHLSAAGLIVGDPGHYRRAQVVSRFEAPASVQALIASRINSLPPAVRNTLIAGAVIGRRFPCELLAKVVDISLPDVRGHLDALVAEHLVLVAEEAGDNICEFRHEFVREAAYTMPLTDMLRHLHIRTLRAAELLFDNRLPDWLGFLSHHALLAGLHVEGLRYSKLAAEQALNSASYKAAFEFCERAIEHIDNLPRSKETIEAAIDVRLLLRIAAGGGTTDFRPSLRYLGEAIKLAEEAGDMPRRLLATIHRTWTLNFAGSAGDAVDSGRAALHLAEALSIPQSEVVARVAFAQALYAQGRYRLGADTLGPAIDWLAAGHETDRIGTTGTTLGLSLMMRANSLASMGRFGAANADLTALRGVVECTGRIYDQVSALYCEGLLSAYRGEPAAAVPALKRGYDICGDTGNYLFLPLIAGLLGGTLTLVGARDQAAEVLAVAIETADSLGHCVARTASLSALAGLRLAEGNAREALRLSGEARSFAKDRGHRGVEITATRVLAQAFMALDPQDVERPAFLLQEAIEIAQDIEAVPALLGCSRILLPLLIANRQQALARAHAAHVVALAEQAGMHAAATKLKTQAASLASEPGVSRGN